MGGGAGGLGRLAAGRRHPIRVPHLLDLGGRLGAARGSGGRGGVGRRLDPAVSIHGLERPGVELERGCKIVVVGADQPLRVFFSKALFLGVGHARRPRLHPSEIRPKQGGAAGDAPGCGTAGPWRAGIDPPWTPGALRASPAAAAGGCREAPLGCCRLSAALLLPPGGSVQGCCGRIHRYGGDWLGPTALLPPWWVPGGHPPRWPAGSSGCRTRRTRRTPRGQNLLLLLPAQQPPPWGPRPAVAPCWAAARAPAGPLRPPAAARGRRRVYRGQPAGPDSAQTDALPLWQ